MSKLEFTTGGNYQYSRAEVQRLHVLHVVRDLLQIAGSSYSPTRSLTLTPRSFGIPDITNHELEDPRRS